MFVFFNFLDRDIKMDRSWMREPTRCLDRYQKGVEEFIKMAGKCVGVGDETKCPCRKCVNRYFHHIHLVERHLYLYGIDPSYTPWIFHGEEDPHRVNVTSNLQSMGMNATIDEIDEVEELLGDVRMGTFLDANIGNDQLPRTSFD